MIALAAVLLLASSSAPSSFLGADLPESLEQRVERLCQVDATIDGDDVNVDAAGLGSVACVAAAIARGGDRQPARAIAKVDCRVEADAVRCGLALAPAGAADGGTLPAEPLQAVAWSAVAVDSLGWRQGGRMLVRGKATSQGAIDALATAALGLDLSGVAVAPAAAPATDAWGGAGDWRLSAVDARLSDLRRTIAADGDAFVAGSAGTATRANATLSGTSRQTLLASLQAHAPAGSFFAVRRGAGLEKGKGRKVDFDFAHVDGASVLRLLGQVSLLNVVAPPAQPSIAIAARNVAWDDLLDAVAAALGSRPTRQGNLVWILPPSVTPPRLDLSSKATPATRRVSFRLRASAAEGESLVDSLTGGAGLLPCGGPPLDLQLRSLPADWIAPALSVAAGLPPGATPCDLTADAWDHHVATLKNKDAVLLATITGVSVSDSRALVRIPLEPLLFVKRATPDEALFVESDDLNLPKDGIRLRLTPATGSSMRIASEIPSCDFRLAATLLGPTGSAALLETRSGDALLLRHTGAPGPDVALVTPDGRFRRSFEIRDGEVTLSDSDQPGRTVTLRLAARAR